MSLVDYASSDEDACEAEVVDDQKHQPEATKSSDASPHIPYLKSSSVEDEQADRNLDSTMPSTVKLPDASLLLNSPITPQHASCSDHSSLVAAAMAENASRKRDADGLASGFPRKKVPKGTLPHSKNVPDTVGGRLLPPQLKGRSNVVTEDISKLFVKGRANPSSA